MLFLQTSIVKTLYASDKQIIIGINKINSINVCLLLYNWFQSVEKVYVCQDIF